MWTYLYFAVAGLVAMCSGCTWDIVGDPNRHSLEPDRVSSLRAPQNVALKNAYSSESKLDVQMGAYTVVFDQRRMTDAAIVMLGRALQKQGITNDAQASKSVELRLRPVRWRVAGMMPAPQRIGTVVLDVRFGDGTTATLEAENSSPANFDRVFDGAILFALRELVADERFVAYMNR
jgi:hypothetical protein